MKKRIIIIGIVVIFFGVGFTTIRNKDLEIVKNLDIYCTLFRELNMFYVDETPPDELITTSINSMLKSLDPYTSYIPEKDMDDFNFTTTGEYGGLGSHIRELDNRMIIADPFEGFPAARAGLRAGDIFEEVDGKSAEDLTDTELSELLKGEPGTALRLKMRRPYDDNLHTFDLIREKIVINNVSYQGMLDDNTGYIKVSNFTTNAAAEVKSAFLELKKNPGFNKLVLDLRGNPGGLMIEAVRMCNLFIDRGEIIVSTRGKVKNWDNEYKTTTSAIDTEIPIVVMVNRSSASAAEIVAGAMQDLDRAVVVGQRTFGKGLVQTTRPLKYNTQLKVTTAKYYIPSGRCIQMLDYSNRNEDGSVGEIPDSLISEYQTKNGRLVYDGGGIQPDIEVIPEEYGEITVRLFRESVLFNYATRYRNRIESIASPKEFELTDDEYADFISFVKEQNFEYQTASEIALNKLVTTAKKEKYYDLSKEEFDVLEKNLAHNNMQNLETFREEIQELLEGTILQRYYFVKGRIEAQNENDIQLDKAVTVISNPVQVQNILIGKEGNLARN